jgi:HK97 family phage portal protein
MMGVFTDTLQVLASITKQARQAPTAIPTWQAGRAALTDYSYETLAREGYGRNEIFFACVEELASSAAEPRIVGLRRKKGQMEEFDEHPLLDLLNKPNPFMTGYEFIAAWIMYRAIAGNTYVRKERSAAGKTVELWLPRPDRMAVVPDAAKFISAYVYQVGADGYRLETNDVIHSKSRNPLNDYYGMPPGMACGAWVDIDCYMRDCVKSFFLNAGVPAGLLNVKRKLDETEKALIRNRWRTEFGGPGSWGNLLVMDNEAEAEYKPMGLPVGAAGLATPELNDIAESRITMPFGVPGILVGTRLGMQRSTYANYREARMSFWDETLLPLYKEIASSLNAYLVPEFADIDAVKFDMSDVQALKPDDEKVHAVAREDMKSGVITVEEARRETGRPAELPIGETLLLPFNIVLTPVGAEPPVPGPGEPAPV